MKRICVFCGSSLGSKDAYSRDAALLGRALAQRKIGLVYGGGRVGIMGRLAKSCLEAGGEVIGVIPRQLSRAGLGYAKVTSLRVTGSMHERKAEMARLADGFIALPGGLGTIEEFFEALTWVQLGIHCKPCGLLNTAGYYDKLIEFIGRASAEEFLEEKQRKTILIDKDPVGLLEKIISYRSPRSRKVAWVLKKKGNLVS